EWQAAFTETVERLAKEKASIKGVILASAKKTFFAGAELKDVLKRGPKDGPAVFRWIESAKKQFRALETLGIPVVAALEGTALGGGWEIALSAHCRIVLDDASIQLGLPEATLGLLPGAGGITKTTRLLGLQAAFPYLVEGRTMRPQEAAKQGLVQGLAANRDDLFRMAREWIKANPEAKQPWDDPKYRMPGGGPSTPAISQMLSMAPAMLVEKTRGLYPAPKAIKAGASRPKDVPKWKATKVGILGAGMMGGGIAYANAVRGVACVLKDVTQEKADAGKAYTAKILERRKKDMKPLELITATSKAEDLRGCDLIIEAVFEKRELKAQVTKDSEPLLAANGFFASNTSTLPISGLAKASAHPDKFIGLHFFSPVDRM